MAKTKEKKEKTVGVPAIRVKTAKLRIVGDTPLIAHKFSDSQKKSILDKQMQKAKTAKEAKDPKRDYDECRYKMSDGSDGFPAAGFKLAAVRAAKAVDGMNMTDARGMFFIMGPLVKIKGKPRMREDTVRLNKTIADLRYRAEYPVWEIDLVIKYDSTRVTVEQIANLLNMAGFSVGVGDWRPEKNGTFGMFHVA